MLTGLWGHLPYWSGSPHIPTSLEPCTSGACSRELPLGRRSLWIPAASRGNRTCKLQSLQPPLLCRRLRSPQVHPEGGPVGTGWRAAWSRGLTLSTGCTGKREGSPGGRTKVTGGLLGTGTGMGGCYWA